MMRLSILVVIVCGCLLCCKQDEKVSSANPSDWAKRKTTLPDSLLLGSTYLPVYSQIYSMTDQETHDLTATISLRNVNPQDSIYILNAEYFDTHGKRIRSYIDHPIFLGPLETVEIVIDEEDRSGGTGANFVFDWAICEGSNEPLFEAVMISTFAQKGLSFTTRGVKMK